jgi:hypothetical protein
MGMVVPMLIALFSTRVADRGAGVWRLAVSPRIHNLQHLATRKVAGGKPKRVTLVVTLFAQVLRSVVAGYSAQS